MIMKTYDFSLKAMYYDRFGKRGIEPRLHTSLGAPKVKPQKGIGPVVLAYNYGIFGDNMPVLWVKHLGEERD